MANGYRAGRFAEYCDIVGITTESMYVGFDLF